MVRNLALLVSVFFLGSLTGCGGGGGGQPANADQQRTAKAVSGPLTPMIVAAYMIRQITDTSDTGDSCPTVTRNGGVTTLNYGAGCQGPETGGNSVSGTAIATQNGGSSTLTFQSLTVNGRTLSGSVTFSTLQSIALSEMGRTVRAEFQDLTLSGTGTVDGEVIAEFSNPLVSPASTVLKTTAPGLTVTPVSSGFTPCPPQTQVAYTVSLNDLTVAGTSGGTVTPSSGSSGVGFGDYRFGACLQHSAVLTFTSSSPTNHTVQVSFDGLPAVTVPWTTT